MKWHSDFITVIDEIPGLAFHRNDLYGAGRTPGYNKTRGECLYLPVRNRFSL